MTYFSLVRHGETDWNKAGRIQGSTDIPLNELGRQQARETGRKLARYHWDLVICSPLSRAWETATIISNEIGHSAPVIEPSIVERNYGEAEGLTGSELEARFPGDTVVPGRESKEQVFDRVLAAMHVIAAEHPGKRILMVVHGGVIRAALQGAVPGQFWHEKIPNGSVHTFLHSDTGLELIRFNDELDIETSSPDLSDFEEQQPLEQREEHL
ncbi:MAG: histidine phosphatase family protein [Microbacteriaceae bacterium]